MPTVRYVSHTGHATELEVTAGTSIMQAAVDNGLEGIVGECGGSAMCATCHVYLDEADATKFPDALSTENEMLECAASPLESGSRLGCQLIMKPETGHVTVRLPACQQ